MYSLNHHSSINLLKKCSKNISNTENGNSQFINYILKRGAVIYPASLSGAPIAKLSDTHYHITNRNDLVKWYNRNIRRYVFRPSSSGMVGIDLDVTHGKNGIQFFIDTTGIDPYSLPHSRTPSGGLHVYFLAGNQDYISTQFPQQGMDIKYHALCTLGGSRSHHGKYTWYGNPANIPHLYKSLSDIIPMRNTDPYPAVHTRGDNLQLDRIHDILIKQGDEPTPGNRNRFVFQMARYARKQGHRPDAVISYLSFLESSDFTSREIQCTVNSAFKGGRHG